MTVAGGGGVRVAGPWAVACLGILVADLVARPVVEVPPPGELRLVDAMGLHVGGCAASTASGLARLGVRAGVLGKVGRDALGDFLLGALRRDGVDTSAVIVDPTVSTSSTMALVGPSGERAFLHCFGGNGALRGEEVALEASGPARILHVAGTGLLPALDGAGLAGLCARARRLGMTVTLDTAWDPLGGWERVLPLLPHVDYFLPSQAEARYIFGVAEPEAVAHAARAHGARAVVVKLGARGCYVAPGPGEGGQHLPALPGPVLDTTGAGDAFCAGFLAGLLHGRDAVGAARLGTAAACQAVACLGAVSGIGSWAQTLAVLERGGLEAAPAAGGRGPAGDGARDPATRGARAPERDAGGHAEPVAGQDTGRD